MPKHGKQKHSNLNLQEEWKKAGPVAKNISDEVWAEFRTILMLSLISVKLF